MPGKALHVEMQRIIGNAYEFPNYNVGLQDLTFQPQTKDFGLFFSVHKETVAMNEIMAKSPFMIYLT